MTTTPDPQTVREIARRSLQNEHHRLVPGWFTQGIGPVIRAEVGPGVTREDFEVWFNAVCEDIRTARIVASWPDGQPQDGNARGYPDSHSPWSQWLTDQLLDHEWTSSGLVEASGHVFDVKQVSRWLHSQDVPEPWAAVLVAKAFGASVIDALRAAEHGVVVDAVLEEDEQPQDERDSAAMTPADVPDEWLQAAFDAIGRSGTSDGDEQMRHVLAAVLPLYRQREQDGGMRTAAECVGRVHPDFANGQDIRCELPDGHHWHRNGERTWMP